jgi:hypothetical protein
MLYSVPLTDRYVVRTSHTYFLEEACMMSITKVSLFRRFVSQNHHLLKEAPSVLIITIFLFHSLLSGKEKLR